MANLILPGSATPAQVLSGYTASAGPYYDTSGTMPNNGSVVVREFKVGHYKQPSGYYSALEFEISGWTAEAADLKARWWVAAAYDSSADLTFAIDGYGATHYLTTNNAYSHASNAWTAEAADLKGRKGLAAAYDSSANLTFAIDGYGATNYLATNNAYSHASNAWTAEAANLTARGDLAAAYDSSANLTFAIDGRGATNYNSTNNAYIY